jgi:uncharacterized protein (DUF305 family)
MRIARAAAIFTLASLALVVPAIADGLAPDKKAQKFESRFMEMTIDHHLLGVQMAQLCVASATPPPPPSDAGLPPLCQQIAQAQSQEVEQLKAWLAQWYGITYAGEAMKPGTLKNLQRKSGEEFDIAISETFIEHHVQQIQNSVECLQRAFHPSLLQLCQQQIATQADEIVEFRAILMDHSVE